MESKVMGGASDNSNVQSENLEETKGCGIPTVNPNNKYVKAMAVQQTMMRQRNNSPKKS